MPDSSAQGNNVTSYTAPRASLPSPAAGTKAPLIIGISVGVLAAILIGLFGGLYALRRRGKLPAARMTVAHLMLLCCIASL